MIKKLVVTVINYVPENLFFKQARSITDFLEFYLQANIKILRVRITKTALILVQFSNGCVSNTNQIQKF